MFFSSLFKIYKIYFTHIWTSLLYAIIGRIKSQCVCVCWRLFGFVFESLFSTCVLLFCSLRSVHSSNSDSEKHWEIYGMEKSRSDYPQTLSSPYNPISHPCQLILEGNESNFSPNTCQMLGIMIQVKHTVIHPKTLSNMQKNGGAKGLKWSERHGQNSQTQTSRLHNTITQAIKLSIWLSWPPPKHTHIFPFQKYALWV